MLITVSYISLILQISSFFVVQLKAIRQLGFSRVIEFFELFKELDYSAYTNELFHAAVWPQVRTFVFASVVLSKTKHFVPVLNFQNIFSESDHHTFWFIVGAQKFTDEISSKTYQFY